jgi:UDP-N-acetylmuramoyl-tripeptide--D-alanyl-D-alanine ligase
MWRWRAKRWPGGAGDSVRGDVAPALKAPIVLTAAGVASVIGGRIAAGDEATAFEGFTTDSRRVGRGQLFIALRGDRFDGAAFVEASVAAGASGVLVPAGTARPAGAVVIEVGDTLLALQALGQHMRRASGASVVAITGSAGKTSTKEATAEFLALRHVVYRNVGNLNNHIGLPLSLLELRSRPEVAVVELGMNHAGEIRRLVEIAEPDVRVWTNVGDAHVGHFASVEAIADAKAEVLERATGATGAVVNGDDPRVMARVGGFPGTVTTFGVSESADVRGVDVQDLGVSGTRARIVSAVGEADVRVPIPGRGPLLNVLAATAVALGYGVPLDAIAARAATLTAASRRGEVTRLAKGVVLVDDSYNSSPAALARALDALGSDRSAARRVAVVGEMRELGEFATALHEESGRRAVAAGIDAIVAVGGAPAEALAAAAIAAGLPPAAVQWYPSSDEAAGPVAAMLRAGDAVLVKGSRGTRTDVVADRVKAEWA